MKRLVLTIAISLAFALGGVAQNVWKTIDVSAVFLGAAPDGSLYFNCGYSGIGRSQDEGETLQIVLGYETGYDYYFNGYCFSVSPEGRIFVFEDDSFRAWFSDDNGGTWQHTSDIPLSAGDKAWNLYALNNDIMVGSTEYGSVFWTTDGGTTWGVNDTFFEDNSITDILANENGDVYIGLYYYGNGLYHSTLSDMQNWEIVAFEGLGIWDMEFDPEGNVVCAGYGDGFSGFEQIPGFYAFEANYISISDNGTVYTINYHDDDYTEGLAYSLDHGEHFTEIGERMYGVRPLPNCCIPMKWLIKGFDNHLYYLGVDQNYKSVRNADRIIENFPLENTAWVQFYRSMYEDSTYYQLGIKGDTVVNETAYKKVINCSHLGYPIEGECFGGIREDGDGKCYFMSFVDAIFAPWPLHYDCEANTEYPLYDFSLSICDVFQTIGLTPHVVFDTAEMQLNGSTRKVLWFSNNCDNGNYYDYQWIEGIGSTHSLLYPIQDEPDNGPEYRLVEVWQDEELLYKNPHFEEDFPYDNTRWAIYYQNLYLDWAPYIQIGIKGDTVVDGTTYHKVIKCTSYGNVIDGDCFGGIRVEADGKWYFRLFSEENVPQYLYLDMEPNTERLIYDYSLSVCDGFEYEGQYWMSVFEIDEIEINGSMRRRLWFDGNCEEGDHTYDWNWIEGIGCNYGLLYSIQAFPLDGSAYHLGEVYQDGELIYRDPYFINEPSSFAPQGAEWYFHVWSQGPITEPPFYYIRHAVTGEAEVQGHLCSVIDGYRYVYEEDGVVYMYNHSTDAFTVMYDFNAEEGDTWYCDIEEGFTCLVTVESVDSVTWNGHTYRTQYVTGYIPDEGFLIYDGRIIEGIGYEKGLFPHEFVYDGTEYAYMRCYLEDGELLYHEGDYDCDYVPGNQPQQPQFEWYYEIQNEDGSITYQYMYQAGDTIVQDEPTHILVKINTLYDKGLRDEVTHEYVYERDGKLYWWNKSLEEFTVLYDYEAEVGDSWEIKVGTRTLDMHVDAVEEIEYEGRTYRMLRVSDPEDLFSGNIVCGIGHLTSFFPERLMDNGDRMRVEGMRCYWSEGELVFKYGDEDCDAIYSEVHGLEEGGPSTPSTGSGTAGTFTVYPNPTNSILFVETRRATSLPDQTYHITNLVGQTVLSGNITADNQQINVSSLPQGMYFITIAGETRKFVVR